MYMNLKLNQDKRISFNTTTPKMLGPPPKFNFLLRSPPRPNYFRLKFLGPPLKLKGGGAATMCNQKLPFKYLHLLRNSQ